MHPWSDHDSGSSSLVTWKSTHAERRPEAALGPTASQDVEHAQSPQRINHWIVNLMRLLLCFVRVTRKYQACIVVYGEIEASALDGCLGPVTSVSIPNRSFTAVRSFV